MPHSDQFGVSNRHQHCQCGGSAANASRDSQERFRNGRMLVGQFLQTRTDGMELFSFV